MTQKGKASTLDEVSANLTRVVEELGFTPSYKEYRESGGVYSRSVFRRLFGTWGNALKKVGTAPRTNQFITPADHPIEVYDEFPRVNAEKVIVAFDPHIPYHDADLWNEMIEVAKKRDIRTLIVGGDFIDFKGLYRRDIQESSIDWAEELSEAYKFMEELQQHFDKIWVIMGNHDWRIVRLLGNNKRATKLYEMIFTNPKVQFTKYYYALINDWLYIVHPDKSRKAKLSLVEELCDHHRKSVIMGHSHRFAFGAHDSGTDVIGEGLCMTRLDTHEYTGLKLDVYSQWLQGFWIVEEGKVAPYIKHNRIANLFF